MKQEMVTKPLMGMMPAAFRRLCVETKLPFQTRQTSLPAAFRRLCVETIQSGANPLKDAPAAFRRLCVETGLKRKEQEAAHQPPSGGCVLKHDLAQVPPFALYPAAFRRLCVETLALSRTDGVMLQPPSGGCVLKRQHIADNFARICQPPSGGCVLKQALHWPPTKPLASRLQAAVC